MKPRKPKDLKKILTKKGFVKSSDKDDHNFYYLYVDGKKEVIHTMVSHGTKEYSKFLMGKIKNQMRFNTAQNCDDYFDCTMNGEEYVQMLRENGEI